MIIRGVGEFIIRGRGLDLAVFDLFRRLYVEPLQSKVLTHRGDLGGLGGYQSQEGDHFGPFWDRFGAILGPFWDHFGIILDHFGTTILVDPLSLSTAAQPRPLKGPFKLLVVYDY